MKKAERAAIFKALCKMALIAYVFLMLWLLFFQRMQQDVPGAYFERLKENFNLFPFLTIRDFIPYRPAQRQSRFGSFCGDQFGRQHRHVYPAGLSSPLCLCKVENLWPLYGLCGRLYLLR